MSEVRGDMREGTYWLVSERVARSGGLIRWDHRWWYHPFFEQMVGKRVAVCGDPDVPEVVDIGIFEVKGCPGTFVALTSQYPTCGGPAQVLRDADGSWRLRRKYKGAWVEDDE